MSAYLKHPAPVHRVPVEEPGCLGDIPQHGFRRRPHSLAYEGELVVLRGPREEGPAQEQLAQHTAQGPHVDGFIVGKTQNDFRSSVGGREDTPLTCCVQDRVAGRVVPEGRVQ